MRRRGLALITCGLSACALLTDLHTLQSDAATADATSDEAGTGFCASHPGHTLCEDFDTPAWSNNVSVSAAPDAASLDDALAHSAPFSFMGTGSGLGGAFVTKSFAFNASDVATIDVWLRVEQPLGTSAIDTILQLVLSPNPPGLSNYHVGVNEQGQQNDTIGFVSAKDAGNTFTPPLGSNALGTFRHFTVVIDRAAHTVKFNGTQTLALFDAAIDSFDLQLGVAYTFGGSQTAHVDDLLVDIGDGGS